MKKALLILLGTFLLINLFIVLYLNLKPQKIPVLTYHNVVDKVSNKNSVDISTRYFEKQMKYFHDFGYKTITMDEFYNWKHGKISLPRKSVLITFDDGWKSVYIKALPIMEKYGIKSNVFVVWKYEENCTKNNDNTYLNDADIEDIKKNHKSLKILSDSYDLHSKQSALSKNYNVYKEDIDVVNTIYPDIKYYAYPYGISNDEYKQALKNSDYKMAFTFGPYSSASKNDDDFAIPRIGIFESTSFLKFKLKLFFNL